MGVAQIMTDAIWQTTGARYRSTSEANVMGLAAGTSADYAAGRDNIPLTYTIFAPNGGENGWDVPADQINRIVDEIFAGVHALAEYVQHMDDPAPF